MTARDNLNELDSFHDEDELNVIIETPKGSRNKYNYDEELRLFKLGGVLTSGAVFPFDFGFLPGTRGDDGDPLDILLLLDDPVPAGCLVRARLVGVIEAEQTERDGETTRNDRLIAVAAESRLHANVRTLQDLGSGLPEEIEHFFVSYNQAKGKEFKPLGHFGPKRALKLVEEGVRQFKKSKKKKRTRAKSGGSKAGGKKRAKRGGKRRAKG